MVKITSDVETLSLGDSTKLDVSTVPVEMGTDSTIPDVVGRTDVDS